MIEFKAECGHTVRAKDDDAGGVVRCSYCGRKVNVPDSRDDDLDFLFRDVGQVDKPSAAQRRRRRGKRRIFGRRLRSSPGQFDPFAIIFRMCYWALLISIVIFVGKGYVIPLFKKGGLWERVVKKEPERPERKPRDAGARQGVRRNGLIDQPQQGIYVTSTPPGAAVYYVEQSKAPSSGSILNGKEYQRSERTPTWLKSVHDGKYVVEVALPVYDKNLMDEKLPYHREYWAFRRAVQNPSNEDRNRRAAEYFVPDGAVDVFIDETNEGTCVVRQYRDVEVSGKQSPGVRALFLPRIVRGDRESFSVAELVTHYLPAGRAYGFDESGVQTELKFHNVPEVDRMLIIDALSRVGVIPYVTPDGKTQLFAIGIYDGGLTARALREVKE